MSKTFVITARKSFTPCHSSHSAPSCQPTNIDLVTSSTMIDIENEADYDTDLEIQEEAETKDLEETWKHQYLSACKYYGIIPATFFLRHMMDEKLIMHHHSLGTLGVKAVAWTLQHSSTVIHLDLEDNAMEAEGGRTVAQMLKDNCYIAELNIANNRLKSRGAYAFGEMLTINTTLQILNISGNEFKDKDGIYFCRALCDNFSLRVLNLSNNGLGEETARGLVIPLKENEYLEELNLSWNHFRGVGAAILCNAIKESPSLEKVNISFNGLGSEGAVAVAGMLTNAKKLKELDVSSNRIGLTGAVTISKALAENTLMIIFKIAHNPMEVAGAKALLTAISTENSAVSLLDMSFVEVDDSFIQQKNEFLKTRPVIIKHGVVLGDFALRKAENEQNVIFGIPADKMNKGNVLCFIKCYLRDKNIDYISYFKNKVPGSKITPFDFIRSLEALTVVLKERQANYLTNVLSEMLDEEGLVDVSELAAEWVS